MTEMLTITIEHVRGGVYMVKWLELGQNGTHILHERYIDPAHMEKLRQWLRR
jgi:hypothetical protein